jgi:hypothetical protein
MAANFVPFLPRVQSAPAAPDKTATFTPVAAPAPAAIQGNQHAGNKAHDFKVELKRDGEKISQIFIQCHCGERIQIDCEY